MEGQNGHASASDKLWSLRAMVAVPSVNTISTSSLDQSQLIRTAMGLRRLSHQFETLLQIQTARHRVQILCAPESEPRLTAKTAKDAFLLEVEPTETECLHRKYSTGCKNSIPGLIKAGKEVLILIPEKNHRVPELIEVIFGEKMPSEAPADLLPGQFLIYYPQARGFEYFTWNNETLFVRRTFS